MAEVNYGLAYDVLSNYINNPDLVKGTFKISQYFGLILGTTQKLDSEFFTRELMAKNMKAYINSYVDFIIAIDDGEELQAKYPNTNDLIGGVRFFSPLAQIETVAGHCFNRCFQNIATSGNSVFIKADKLKYFEEYMVALNNGDAKLAIVLHAGDGAGVVSLQSYYDLMFDSGSVEDLGTDTDWIRAVAMAKYLIENRGGQLWQLYVPAEYFNNNSGYILENWQGTEWYKCPYFILYRAASTSKTLYFNSATNEWQEEHPGGGGVYSKSVPDLDTDGAEIDHITLSTVSWSGNIEFHFFDKNDNAITTGIAYSANDNTAAAFLASYSFQSSMLSEPIPDDYRRRVPDLNSYNWQYGQQTRYMHFDEVPWASAVTNEIIAQGGLIMEKLSTDVTAKDETVNAAISDEYKPGYAEGELTITDMMNGDSIEIKIMDDEQSTNVANGDANVTEIMEGGGNYIITSDGDTIGNTTTTPEHGGGDGGGLPDIGNWVMPSGLYSFVILSAARVRELGRKLFDPSFLEYVKQAFNAPMDAIISLGFIPYGLEQYINSPNKQIVLGGYETGVYGAVPNSQYIVNDYEPIPVPGGQPFYRYEPYADYKIFIPFCGWQDVPAGMIVGHNINVQTRIDLLTGDLVAHVGYRDAGGEAFVIGEYNGNCMRQIPIAQMQSGMHNAAATAIGMGIQGAVAASGAGVGAMMIANTATGAIMPGGIGASVRTSGKLTGNSGFMASSRQPKILCRYKDFSRQLGQIDYTIGRWVSVRDIPQGARFTASELRINAGITMTADEAAEIRSLFSQGITC